VPASPQRSPRSSSTPPTSQGFYWVVGLVVVVAIGGVVWLRHAIQSAAPSMEEAVPTRPPPKFQRTPFAPRGQSDAHFEADDTVAMQREQAPAARAQAAPVKHSSSASKPNGAPVPPEAAKSGDDKPAGVVAEAAPEQEASQTPAGRAPGAGPSLSISFDGSASGAANGADQAEPIIAQGLQFDPTLGAARFPPNAQLAYPDMGGVDPSQGTIGFWVRVEADPNVPVDGRTLAELQTGTWQNRLTINMGPRSIGLLLTNSDGVEQGVSDQAIEWKPNVWRHVAVTWGDAIMQLYEDGTLTNQNEYSGSLVLPPGTPMYVASQRPGPTPANEPHRPTISLRGWSVFQRILEPEEVARLMVQTAPPM
jgi:concanavalin A-like lectin/glucanase superfamily protein